MPVGHSQSADSVHPLTRLLGSIPLAKPIIP